MRVVKFSLKMLFYCGTDIIIAVLSTDISSRNIYRITTCAQDITSIIPMEYGILIKYRL